jgi:hypothetical protein
MKEEFHAKFAAILQKNYQREWLAYLSNRMAISFDPCNMGQLVN